MTKLVRLWPVAAVAALAVATFTLLLPASHLSAPAEFAVEQTPVVSPAIVNADELRKLELELAVVCPEASHALRAELAQQQKSSSATINLCDLVPVYRELAARDELPAGRITGIRVAQRPVYRVADNSGALLVDPKSWFTPEEQAQQAGVSNTDVAQPEEASVPADVPPATAPVPVAPAPEAPQATVDVAPLPPQAEPARLPDPLPTVERVSPPPPQLPVDAATPPAAAPFAPPPLPRPEVDLAKPPGGEPLGFENPSGRLPSPHGPSTTPTAGTPEGDLAHRELLEKNCYPSALECAKCHQKHYDEWAISSHAYAMVSPMFHKFEQKIRVISQGTVGHFCYRCHAPVATAMRVGQEMPLWELSHVEREGVTCIACHRVKYRYTKSNGERRVEPGDNYAPVYGTIGGDGVAEVIAQADKYKVKTSDDQKGPGQPIHREAYAFEHLSRSEFCAPCHQVAVHPGIKLEVVYEQFRASPAQAQGITCQDCHMGRVPGVPSGYECCAIAVVNEKPVNENRKHGNHTFWGPGYSIAHPGIFPFHPQAKRWSIDEWLQFDWRSAWGTDDFEDQIDDGTLHVDFPPAWSDVDDRYDAREIIDDNLKKLARKTESRRAVMENGSQVDGPFFAAPPQRGCELVLHYEVTNTNSGHNLPTGSLGAQPQLWANAVLVGPRGQRVWESGHTDSFGDVCDIHSVDVRQGRVPFDSQLFNLQTMFLITGATGTDREFFLPVNIDFDQLPFLRPGAIPISVTNHPPFIRMEGRSIAPLGKKRAKYTIPASALCEPGVYRLSFRLRSRTEPMYFMRFCESTVEMQRAMQEGTLDVHPYSVEFVVE